MKVRFRPQIAEAKWRTIRKVMGGGDFLPARIFFLAPFLCKNFFWLQPYAWIFFFWENIFLMHNLLLN